MSDGPLSPEEVAHRGFGTAFRGFDTGEVRAYLQRVANDLRAATGRERDLHRRLADAEHRAAHPVLEGDTLTRALGDEMGSILATAQDAANGLKDKAEENAARILREAHDQAQRIRAQAEAILAVRTEEADAEAAEIRRAAESAAAGVVERASREAVAAMSEVEGKARQVVHDAQAARARVLGDLSRRRRLLQTQVEQLRAGRERLLEAYRKVRSTTDEVADELQRVEDEARQAAGAAAERLAAEPLSDDLDDVLAAFPGEPAAGDGVEPGEDGPDGGVRVPEAPRSAAAGPDAGDGASGDAPLEGGASWVTPVPPAPADATAEVTARPAGQAVGTAEVDGGVFEAEAPAGEAAERSPATGVAAPPPQVVSTRPGGAADRRPLRLLRRPRADGPPPDVAPVASGGERVRLIPPGPAPAAADGSAAATEVAPTGHDVDAVEPAGAEATDVEADAPSSESDEHNEHAAVARTSSETDPLTTGEAEAAAAGVSGVDELFARIRAGRADAVARAEEVLAADPGKPVEAPASPSPEQETTVGTAETELAGPGEEEMLLRRRDTAVEGMEAKLARKLKRALQDEQNEVLDRLRSAKAGAGPDAVLLAPDGQVGRYRQAAEELLGSSAAAGVAFVEPRHGDRPEVPDVADVAADLAASLAEPLRRALERALRGDGADQAAVVERIGAAYRECKGQRIEGLAGDAVTAAFGRGTLAALPPGASSRWVVDDDGRPCPDCDDNALAGPTPAGEGFPTGQAHPPAHAGCRCLLAPAELASAMTGAG